MKYKSAIVIAGILTGLIGALVKIIVKEVNIMTLSFLRMSIATIFTGLLILIYNKNLFKIEKGELFHYVRIGLLMAITFSLYVSALKYAPVNNVALITSLNIIIVALIAWIFLKEKLTSNQKIAIPLALVGLIILNPLSAGKAIGNMLAMIQVIFYSLFIVFLRKEEKHTKIGSVFYFFLFATIFLIPFPIIYGIGNVQNVIFPLLILGIFSTSLTYLLLSYGLKGVSSETGALLVTVLFPTSSIVFAYLIIREIPDIRAYVGGFLLIIAAIIAISKQRVIKHLHV